MAKRPSRAERHLIDTAWHEAGHVVGALAAGIRVSSVRLTGERGVGKMAGQTQIWGADVYAVGTETLDVQALAADAVDMRRGVDNTGGHVLEVADSIGAERMRERLDLARALVEREWSWVENIATALLSSPDHALYDWRDEVLESAPTAEMLLALGVATNKQLPARNADGHGRTPP